MNEEQLDLKLEEILELARGTHTLERLWQHYHMGLDYIKNSDLSSFMKGIKEAEFETLYNSAITKTIYVGGFVADYK